MSDQHSRMGSDEEYRAWREAEREEKIMEQPKGLTIDIGPPGSALPVPVQPLDALAEFGDPMRGIARATALAERLTEIVEQKRLAVTIQGNKYLKIEAWMTLGALCGVMASTAETKADENGFWAKTEVIRLATGEVISSAQSRCDFTEQMKGRDRWDRAEPHACMSMAQTRSASKALAQCLRWIPAIAGYSGTPAEEMPMRAMERDLTQGTAVTRAEPKPPTERVMRKISDAQRKRLWAIWNARVDELAPHMARSERDEILRAIVAEIAKVEHSIDIPVSAYDKIVEAAERWLPEGAAVDHPDWDGAPE